MGGGRRIHNGQVAGEVFKDGMVVSFDRPCRSIERDDTLAVRTPNGEMLEIFPAAGRPDGAISVWYAPHPLLRHWLGWMERIDDLHWSFRMEAHHVDILRGIREVCANGDR
jgi:hypothetical protein